MPDANGGGPPRSVPANRLAIGAGPPSANRPIYLLVADAIRQRISDSAGVGGARLPSEAELVRSFGVSRQTVRRAYQELVGRGLVSRRQGAGSYVETGSGLSLFTPNPVDDQISSIAWETHMDVVQPLRRGNHPVLARALGLHLDDVYLVDLLRTRRDEPVLASFVALPIDIGQKLQAIGAMGRRHRFPPGSSVVGFVGRIHDRPIVGTQHTIKAEAASAEVAALLDGQVGMPLLNVEQIFFDEAGRPVAAMIAHYDSAKLRWTMKVRQVPQ